MTEEIEFFDPVNVDALVESERIESVEFFEVLGGGAGGGGGGGPETLDILAAENIPAFSFVTVTGFVANSANTGHFGKVIGIVQLATLAGFIASAVDEGEIVNPAWAWSPGQKLFLNGSTYATSGGGLFSQKVALARSSNTIVIRIEPPIFL